MSYGKPRLPRKLLLVERDDGMGYNLLLEHADKGTHSYQIETSVAEDLIPRIFELIVSALRKKGVQPHIEQGEPR